MKAIHLLISLGFLAWLARPAAQKSLHLIPKARLGGVEQTVPAPRWTWATWFDGTLQPAVENRYRSRFPLRAHLVKSWNQLHYMLTGSLPSRRGTQVTIGCDNWLYERPYLQAYNQGDAHKESDLRAACGRLRRAQDLLRGRGLGFLLVIAPSKVEIYPEFVPPGVLKEGRAQRRTAYDRLVPMLRDAGVHLIDGPALFREWKPDSPYPLFPKGGTHWNYYSAARVTDRILQELSVQTGRPYPRLEIASVQTNAAPDGTDDDLFDTLNLWGDFSLRSTASFRGVEVHPQLRAKVPDGAAPPNLLLVGDSFALTLTEVMDRAQLCRNHDTLFYFKRRFSQPPPGEKAPSATVDGIPFDPAALDLEATLKDRDAVIIEVNEQWLPRIGFGFVEALLKQAATGAAPRS